MSEWREIMATLLARKPDVTLRLPKPPSVNNAYVNVAGKGRVRSLGYKIWTKQAKDMLWGQKWGDTITGPTAIIYEVPKISGIQDCANYEKAASDFLVDMRIIKDDSLIWFNCQTWTVKNEMAVAIFRL